jgi:hypothetical protein
LFDDFKSPKAGKRVECLRQSGTKPPSHLQKPRQTGAEKRVIFSDLSQNAMKTMFWEKCPILDTANSA